MAAYVTMPKLSDTMSEVTLVKWLKKEGDAVSMDEEIAEVETDKATMAMPSFDAGIIHKIYVQEGQSAPLGAARARGALRITFYGFCLRDARACTSLGGGPLGFQVRVAARGRGL